MSGEGKNGQAIEPDCRLDITSYVCPMTFVKTKLQLEDMEPGQTLGLRIRLGESYNNVTRSVRDEGHPEFSVFKFDEHLIRGSWGAEYCEEIAPRPGEPVVDKQCHDCFSHTEMEAVLARLGIRPCEYTVIVTGVALDVCVSHAVLGFSVRDYWVAVPMDTTASHTEQAEVVAYQKFMHSAYAYNVGITRSDLIEFRPGVGAPVAAAAAVAR